VRHRSKPVRFLVHSKIKSSVLVTLIGEKDVPKAPEVKELPCHKKNLDLGMKHVYYDNEIFVEQEDALTFKEDEEVQIILLSQLTLDYFDGLGQRVYPRNLQEHRRQSHRYQSSTPS